MKKILGLGLLFVFLGLPISVIHAEEVVPGYIKTNEETSVFDKINNELEVVGSLEENQTFEAFDYGGDYLRISFSHGTGLVQKEDVQFREGRKTSNSNDRSDTIENDESLMMVTKRDVTVFDNSSGDLVPFATIKKNMRYAVVADDGHWWKVLLGNRVGYVYKTYTKKSEGVPVLMYHHILKEGENKNFLNISTTISESFFEENMEYLSREGYETISLNELEGYLNKEQNLKGKVVAITFDDGLKTNNIYATPILKKYGFQATEFLITGRNSSHIYDFDPDNLQFLCYSEIKEMNNSGIWNFESHTFGMHGRLKDRTPIMIDYTYDQIVKDLKMTQEQISPYNDDVRYLAYPYGQYDQEALKAVRDAGFHMAFTTQTGNAHIGDPLLELPRQGVGPWHDMNDFKEKVGS